MSKPILSIIVPVYCGVCYLRECVASVQAQTVADWELLLAEDGSPDDSLALCRHLAATDSRLQVLALRHGGAGAARNTALEVARGQYVLFLDCDDMLATPTALAEMLCSMGDADVLCFNYTRSYASPGESAVPTVADSKAAVAIKSNRPLCTCDGVVDFTQFQAKESGAFSRLHKRMKRYNHLTIKSSRAGYVHSFLYRKAVGCRYRPTTKKPYAHCALNTAPLLPVCCAFGENVWRRGCYTSSACLKLLRRDFLLKNKLQFQNKHCEDVVFCGRLLACTPRLVYCPKPLYCYRVTPGSISRQITPALLAALCTALEELCSMAIVSTPYPVRAGSVPLYGEESIFGTVYTLPSALYRYAAQQYVTLLVNSRLCRPRPENALCRRIERLRFLLPMGTGASLLAAVLCRLCGLWPAAELMTVAYALLGR